MGILMKGNNTRPATISGIFAKLNHLKWNNYKVFLSDLKLGNEGHGILKSFLLHLLGVVANHMSRCNETVYFEFSNPISTME